MHKATNKECLKATKEREVLVKIGIGEEVVKVLMSPEAEKDGTLERYHQVLSSIRRIIKTRDEQKDETRHSMHSAH